MTSILPPPKFQVIGLDGSPVAGGTIQTLIVNTSVPKTTWQDAGQITANTNPVVLDSDGSCFLFGVGDYRLIINDQNGNLIWDAFSSAPLPDDAISAAMLPVVGAATTATAVELLGIPALIQTAIDAVELLPGATGPTGPTGPAGAIGPTGPGASVSGPILNGGNPGFLQLQNVNGTPLNFFFQFGQGTTGGDGNVTVTFAQSYPNGCFGVLATPLYGAAPNVTMSMLAINATAFVATSSSINFPGGGFKGPVPFSWLAIGY